MKELNIFHDTARDPYAYVEKWKKSSNKKVIGYFCTYAPEELIYAADVLPFRIFSTHGDIKLAEAHLQAYSCLMVRSGLEDALSQRLHFLDGTLFPHTCDSIQRLSDIWRLNAGFPLHYDIILPVRLDTKAAKEYMVDVFIKFKEELENGLGKVFSKEELKKTVRVYNRIRKHIANIYELRSQFPELISGGDMHDVVKTALVMDRNDLCEHLDALYKKLDAKKREVRLSEQKRIIISGGICNHPDIYSILEEFGAVVVWDDLCSGGRFFTGEIDENLDPVEAIAQRYLKRVVCPSKHSGLYSRGDNLVKLAKRHNADGVVFLILKFCDPHSFDYPYMKTCLDNEDIPNMLLEVDAQLSSSGQLRTRLETFVSML